MRSQASAFLIERTSLEKIIKEQQANLVELEIKVKSLVEEIDVYSLKLREKEDMITRLNIDISAKGQGEEQTIIDLRLHYEEMLKYQEVFKHFAHRETN